MRDLWQDVNAIGDTFSRLFEDDMEATLVWDDEETPTTAPEAAAWEFDATGSFDGQPPEGQSRDLAAVFQAVTETTCDGAPKYAPHVCRELGRLISLRAYSPAILELCHLVDMVDACGSGRDGYERFFWAGGPALPGIFRAYIGQAIGTNGWRRDGFTLLRDGIRADYMDGAFKVTFARMPVLSALMEFLLTAIGYAELDDIFSAAITGRPSRASLSRAAGEVSKRLYAYLKDQVPSAQVQRKFRRMVNFAEVRHGAGFDAVDLEDSDILEFWRDESPRPAAEGGADFKTYRSVLRAFVRLAQALTQAREIAGLEHPAAMGKDRAAGEIDPDLLAEAIEEIELPANPLDRLLTAPADAVKFVNRQEAATIRDLLSCGRWAKRFALSLLRAEVFGRGQSRIIQGFRRGMAETDMNRLLRDAADTDYPARIEEIHRVLGHLDRATLAGLYALLMLGSESAVSVLLSLCPDLDLGALKDELQTEPESVGNVVTLAGEPLIHRFLSLIGNAKIEDCDLADLISAARRAFRALSRQGFEKLPRPGSKAAEGFEAGTEDVHRVAAYLREFIEHLDEMALPESDWPAQFRADEPEFTEQFITLYGGVS